MADIRKRASASGTRWDVRYRDESRRQRKKTFERKVDAVDTAGISTQANQTLADLHQLLGRADRLMARIDSEAGLINSVQRATDSIGDVASNARGTGPKLDQTLEHVSDMADSMQRLLDALERDPDMLGKGHARSFE